MTPFVEITLISIGLAFLVSIIYRIFTKPDEVRKIKDDMKFYKEKMNEANKAGDKEKASDYGRTSAQKPPGPSYTRTLSTQSGTRRLRMTIS